MRGQEMEWRKFLQNMCKSLTVVSCSGMNHHKESHQEAPLCRSALSHVGEFSPGKETDTRLRRTPTLETSLHIKQSWIYANINRPSDYRRLLPAHTSQHTPVSTHQSAHTSQHTPVSTHQPTSAHRRHQA